MSSQRYCGLDVVVTGGTRGIGRGISTVLASKGYGIHAVYQNRADDAKAMVEEIQQINSAVPVCLYKVDLQQVEVVEGFFEQFTIENGSALIGLVNNAGTRPFSPTINDHLATYKLNTVIPYFLTEEFSLYRKRQASDETGVVVNIGSTSGIYNPLGGHDGYAASKAALIRGSAQQAKRLARNGLKVNMVQPGPVATELSKDAYDTQAMFLGDTPTNRFTTPQEIGEVVLFYLEQRENNLVGSSIAIDGGRMC